MGKVCEICKNEIEGSVFEVEGHDAVCMECATKLAVKAHHENRPIEILETGGRCIDEWALCTWCEELYPKSELREEANLGFLCGHCVGAIHSRGEELIWKY